MIRSKLTAAALMIAALTAPTMVMAHANLDHVSPAVGSTVASSPDEVTLYFSEKIEPKFSGAEIRNAAGGRVDRGASASGNTLRIDVKTLPPGTYGVSWHVLSVDTHKTQGSFSFTVGK
jgi:methionine-rich copper-binding protein CopC